MTDMLKNLPSCLCKLSKSRFTVAEFTVDVLQMYHMFCVFYWLAFCTAGYCSVQHVNWFCCSGCAGSVVVDEILFLSIPF